ncbi:MULTISPECIES: ferredoxin [unclassified Streptomyces]|uniref:ferredoxin n=1 Tax=Streptomyces sp. SID8367 TaxID=2690349 RepID=UPI000DC49FFB|nr:ferredoxin [Streptomyces sp. PsTaAH-137]RAJ85189.1 ferredoxin [Streptomyces sp. PsTaAH-137]
MSAVRVEVDKDRCVGAGMCALTAPDVFTQDDDGLSEVLPGHATAAGEHPLLKEAVRACPVGAVALTDEENT